MTGSNETVATFAIGDQNSESSQDSAPYSLTLQSGEFAFSSCRGVRYKEVNEDRILIVPKFSLFSIIDGMGGPGDGEKASEIFVEEFSRIYAPTVTEMRNIQEDVSHRIQLECMTAHSGICFVNFWIDEDILNLCHVGDVKMLLVDGKGEIKFETKDHSLVNSWIDAGYISSEEAINHPQRHIITRALTGNEIPEMEVHQMSWAPGDRIVVATDGLWDNFTATEVLSIIQGLSPKEGVSSLMKKSCTKMFHLHSEKWDGVLLPKPDNISILIGDITL